MPSSTVAFFALVYDEMDHWMLLDSTPGNLLQFLKHHGFWSRLANWNPHPGRLHVSILREQKETWSCFVVLSFSIVSIMVSSTFLMMQRDAMGLITGMICEATMASWSRKPFRSSERVCFHISHPIHRQSYCSIHVPHRHKSFLFVWKRISDTGPATLRSLWLASDALANVLVLPPWHRLHAFWYEFHASLRTYSHTFASCKSNTINM